MVKVTSSDLVLNNTLTPPLIQQKKMGITGSIGIWVGISPPAGALLCDGATYNSLTNPQLLPLANKLGFSTAGSFQVPNLQGRLPRGTNSTTPPPDGSLRKTDGNLQIQSIGHTHTINQSRFVEMIDTDTMEFGLDESSIFSPISESTSNVTTTNNASDTQIDYLPRYLAVNFIIYT